MAEQKSRPSTRFLPSRGCSWSFETFPSKHNRSEDLPHVFLRTIWCYLQKRVLIKWEKSCLAWTNYVFASGQKFSVSKTNLFFSRNVTVSLPRSSSRDCGFRRTEDLGKYLGVPLLATAYISVSRSKSMDTSLRICRRSWLDGSLITSHQ